jgi:hypothetical protein
MNEIKTAQFIRQHLDQGADGLSYKAQQRLQAGRLAAVRAASMQNSPAAAPKAERSQSIWSRFSLALPAMALVAGLYGITHVGADDEAEEIALVDTQLMLDDVPVNAYADHGFGVFIINTRFAEREMRGE